MQPPPSARAVAKAATTSAVTRAFATKRPPRAAPSVAKSTKDTPSPSSAGQPKWKLMMYTGLFAAVIFTGTIYGAGLKTQQEWKTEKQKVQEASVDDKVAILQQRRKDLERQKDEIEAKLDILRARVKAKAEFEAEQRSEGSGR